MIGRPQVTESREDVSRFMVHLTRNDSGEWTGGGGDTARRNFLAIYNDRTILAPKAHCLHANKVASSLRKKFHVACFSEMPLTALRHVTQPIPGRQIQLEPYGFVFKREFIIGNGGQEVTYVNSYEGNNDVRDGYDSIFEIAAQKNFMGRMWRTLPFLSAMHDRCDFSWEREWRVLGEVKFNYSDLVCVILPENEMGIFKFKLAQNGIAWISPEWSFEKMVESLTDQQRKTRRLKPPTDTPKIPRRLSKA